MSTWEESLGEAWDRGPITFFLKIWRQVIVVSLLLGATAFYFGLFGEASQVIRDEYGPKAMLAKYNWFKDVAAQLDKKQADITVYDGRLIQMRVDYKSIPRNQWSRDDREQFNVWSSEVAGVKASYNSLAAEYNAAMSKYHWKFTNIGDLPPGVDRPLPREFKPYIGE